MATDYEARVERLKTPEECRRMEYNARQKGREDIALLARKKRVELGAAKDIGEEGATEALHQDLWRAFHAHEQMSGRPATRTRQMIRNRGLIAAADEMVQKRKDSGGLAQLVDAGLVEHAWESVVLRYPEQFSEGAQRHSQARLERHTADAEMRD